MNPFFDEPASIDLFNAPESHEFVQGIPILNPNPISIKKSVNLNNLNNPGKRNLYKEN